MERDLLQQECDSSIAKINKNDTIIRKLVEELKIHDQQLSQSFEKLDIIDKMIIQKKKKHPMTTRK